jgi:hypothetical protein
MAAKAKAASSIASRTPRACRVATCTTPAKGDERAQVLPLLDTLCIRTGAGGRPCKRFKVLAADQGYDAKELRQHLRRRGIRLQIPKRVWKTQKPR